MFTFVCGVNSFSGSFLHLETSHAKGIFTNTANVERSVISLLLIMLTFSVVDFLNVHLFHDACNITSSAGVGMFLFH